MAYFLVHSLASWLYLSLTNGKPVRENSTLGPDSAGLLVRLENSGDLWDQRIVGVWITEERADREEDLADGEGGRPLGPQDVQTDGAIGVNVRVVNTGGEGELWRLEWVIRWEVYIEEKYTTFNIRELCER